MTFRAHHSQCPACLPPSLLVSAIVARPLQKPHSLLADQQNKSSDSYQQSKQNTDDERRNRMPTGLDLFRPSAFLRSSDTQPEEKFVHRQKRFLSGSRRQQLSLDRRCWAGTPFNKFFDQSYGGDRCDKRTDNQQPFGAAAIQNRNNDPHHAYPDGDQQPEGNQFHPPALPIKCPFFRTRSPYRRSRR